MRAKGSRDHIVLLSEGTDRPHDKPCLSKGQLTGAVSHEDNCLLTAAAAAESSLDLRLGWRAEALDVDARRVLTSEGVVSFDRLVIATGARARTLDSAALPGVHVLRTSADCEALRADLGRGPLVVVGGGFIGCEVAASARGLGVDVVLVEPLPDLLPNAGPEVGGLVAGLHRDHGVDVRTGRGVHRVRRGPEGLGVDLSDGTTVTAGTVLVGIGAVPNVEWLAGSGLHTDDGVACDAWGRVRAPGGDPAGVHDHVFAVGDVSRWEDPAAGRRRRVEHWTNAVEQAVHVARVLRATDPDAHESTEEVPPHTANTYVWSDQYDVTLHMVGSRSVATDVVPVHGVEAQQTAWIGSDDDGALAFAAVANWPRALLAVRKAARDHASADDVRDLLARTVVAQPSRP